MNVLEYLEKVSYVAKKDSGFGYDNDVYLSSHDGSYITMVGMEDHVKFLADLEITDELTHGVGFSPKDGKWYGWSHRAIYGFEIGSTCKKGDCHYIAQNESDSQEDAIRFWQDKHHKNVRCEGIIERDGERYYDIKWEYTDDVPNKKLHLTIEGVEHHIKPLGMGEWVAETLGDAKSMAQDFNQGVS